MPRFIDPPFLFPDWPTLSTFAVKTPLTQTTLNADNLPIAESEFTNSHLPPYSTRLGTDRFAPTNRWVSGAQRWNLGDLAPGQSVSHDFGGCSSAACSRVT